MSRFRGMSQPHAIGQRFEPINGEHMIIHFELYASLMSYLPERSSRHRVTLEVPVDFTPNRLLDTHGVPRHEAHLVSRNGVFVPVSERDDPLSDGDVLAVWPPVAGG